MSCKGITKLSHPCKNYALKLKEFCYYHLGQEKIDRIICCVCLEGDTPEPLSPCNHRIHISCIWKSGSSLCPVCRIPVTLTKNQKKKMNIQKVRFEKEDIDDETDRLRRENYDDYLLSRITFTSILASEINDLF